MGASGKMCMCVLTSQPRHPSNIEPLTLPRFVLVGWWGLARHFNYTGDLVLSFAMCAACGFQHVLPWFYVVYMTILLVQRIHRDDARCTGKYGKYWADYKKLVRYNLIPYVY